MPVATEQTTWVEACECITPLGDTEQTWKRLCEGDIGLKPRPALGDAGDLVPLCLFEEMAPGLPPRWMPRVSGLLGQIEPRGWGSLRRPVFVSSSNFGIDALYYAHVTGAKGQYPFASADRAVETLRQEMGWGENVSLYSHACVSAHIALMAATAALQAGAEEALVVSFDFLSPFVAGGFNSLKILNGRPPRPYHAGSEGAIGLGEGAAYAILNKQRGPYRIDAQHTWNEMYHFTSNQPDGEGFEHLARALKASTRGKRVWIKGHGTGTLEAGHLEAEAFAKVFPGAPLVSWKGALGHTLGSCGLVEMALACKAIETELSPGALGTTQPYFVDTVIPETFEVHLYDGALLCSNAFGGAQAGLLLSHA